MSYQLLLLTSATLITGLIYSEAYGPLCTVNSAPNICGTLCEPSCTNPNPNRIFCPTIACTNNTRGCRCNSGYLRDTRSKLCVKPNECPPRCAAGETLLSCGRACEGTCSAPFEPEICSRIRCYVPGCGCNLRAGYVRQNSTDSCVPFKQCGCRV